MAGVDAINPAIAGLIRGNGELAAEFYQGRYILLGAVVEAGPKCIFETMLPSLAAYRELHGFGWLQRSQGGRPRARPRPWSGAVPGFGSTASATG